MTKLLIALILSLSIAFAQDHRTTKIKIRHADPYLILMLISTGVIDFNLEPETSTRPATGGFSGGFGGSSGGYNGPRP